MCGEIHAALDESGAGMAFAAVSASGDVIFDEYIPMNRNAASSMPGAMMKILADHGLTFQDVKIWSVGAGPGSFTGLRLASSFVMGLTFGKEIRNRTVSTASMIAENAAAGTEKVLVLFDGRKKEILAYGLDLENGSYVENGFHAVIRNGEDLEKAMAEGSFGAAAAFEADHNAVRAVVGEAKADESVIRVEKLSALALIRFRENDFSRPLTDLLYQRPPVFVEPVAIRTL